MPDPANHAENRNIVESVLRYIPGFRGYLEKEYRRESDSLLRAFMVEKLEQAKSLIDQSLQELVDLGQLSALPKAERLRTKIDRLRGKISGAMGGYSGFFDFVRVGEEELSSIYDHDQKVVEGIGVFHSQVREMTRSPDHLIEALSSLHRSIEELERQFEGRRAILVGLSDSV
ncbi:MAG: hypothetical protein MPJ24_10155 [Pirellulaceae bacterium]|nr:hypothetical protein [Pirellulaceae bacterium]